MYIISYNIYILINVHIKFDYNVFHYDIKIKRKEFVW